MNFSEALIALKNGESVKRESWNPIHWIFQIDDNPTMMYWSSTKGHYVPTYEDLEATDWGIVD